MAATYTPRSVAIVALVSLVAGFLVVFGGGMLMMRTAPVRRVSARLPAAPAVESVAVDAAVAAGTVDATGVAEVPDSAITAPPPEPVAVAGIALGTPSIQRCFDQGPPTPILGAGCDRLVGIEQHFAARAPQIAACARPGAHGRLSLVLDFRFSTNYMRGWGTPSSSIPAAGTVAACVKEAITPLPFAATTHAHDRYVLVEAIEW